MRALLITSALAIGVVCSRCSASGPDGVAEILDAWSKRAEAVKQGEIRWSVPAEDWGVFGRFETEWVPASDAAGHDVTGTLRFDEQRARYNSTSFSFSEYAALSAQQTTDMRFQVAARAALFRDPRYEYRSRLPYRVMYLPDHGIRFWHDNQNTHPLALVLPAGPWMGLEYLWTLSDRNLKVSNAPAGGFSAYLHHLLAAPALLAFRPVLFDVRLRDRDACELDENGQPVYEGRTCRVLRSTERIKAGQSSGSLRPVEALYWVDPSRDFVVMRCIIMWDDVVFAQIDIQYKAMKEVGWVPSKWTVLRFGETPNTVQQVATAVMEDVHFDQAADAEEIDLRLPSGTWVVDPMAQRQYLVRDDSQHQEMERDYRFPVNSYATLLPRTREPSSIQRRVRRILLGLVHWPGVLIPVIIMSGVLIITKRVVTRRRSHGRSDESPANQPDSEMRAKESGQ